MVVYALYLIKQDMFDLSSSQLSSRDMFCLGSVSGKLEGHTAFRFSTMLPDCCSIPWQHS